MTRSAASWQLAVGLERDQGSPERNLLAAVLMRAIQDFAQIHCRRDGSSVFVTGRNSENARDWIVDDNIERFSFIWICWQLDLDPDAVRSSVLRLKGKCAALPPMNNAQFYSMLRELHG